MTKGYDLPLHVAEAVKREAGPEPVLWVGQPDAAAVFRSARIVWLFAIPWSLFSFMWEAAAIAPWLSPWLLAPDHLIKGATVRSIGMPLFGLPFVLIGVAMLSAPWWAARAARNQAHFVTQRTLHTVTANRDGSINAERTDLSRVTRLVRKQGRTDFGTLTVHRGKRRDSDGDYVDDVDTWYGIPDVRHVEALISGLISRRAA